MQLFFSGTGAAFNPAMGNTGAYFTRGADLYLIDCGETLFSKVMKTEMLESFPGSLTIILTHMHADHCGSLGTMALYAAERLNRPITLVHPNDQVRTLLSLMGVRDNQYRLVSSLDERGVTVTARPAKHVPAIPAYSYLLSDEAETIYYSGDTGELPADILDGLREGRVTRAYQDVNIFPRGVPASPAHLPLSTLCGLVEPALRSKFTLMHFNTDFTAEAARLGFECAEIDRFFFGG